MRIITFVRVEPVQGKQQKVRLFPYVYVLPTCSPHSYEPARIFSGTRPATGTRIVFAPPHGNNKGLSILLNHNHYACSLSCSELDDARRFLRNENEDSRRKPSLQPAATLTRSMTLTSFPEMHVSMATARFGKRRSHKDLILSCELQFLDKVDSICMDFTISSTLDSSTSLSSSSQS